MKLFNGLSPIADTVQDIALDLENDGYTCYGPLLAEYSRLAEEEIGALKAKLAEVEHQRDKALADMEMWENKAERLLEVKMPTLTEENFTTFEGRNMAYRSILDTPEWKPVAYDFVALINKERGV